jgi:hypothetical protein
LCIDTVALRGARNDDAHSGDRKVEALGARGLRRAAASGAQRTGGRAARRRAGAGQGRRRARAASDKTQRRARDSNRDEHQSTTLLLKRDSY